MTGGLGPGDPWFPGGAGNTFANGANVESPFHDVRTKLFDRLPEETWFCPGHGDDSSLSNERPHLDEWHHRKW